MSDKKTVKLSILFRADAGHSLGLGHLSRCRSLITTFNMLRPCSLTLVTNSKDIAKDFLGDIPVDLHHVGSDFTQNPFDIAIVDVPNISADEQQLLRRSARNIVCIDDGGPGILGQDILIRPNIMNSLRPDTLSEKQYWTGGNYIILHPDFGQYAEKKSEKNKDVKKLLVCFGGSDPGGLTLRVIPLLQQLGAAFHVHIVLGPAFQWRNEIEFLIKKDNRFLVSYNLPNMAEALWQSDMAIISGGTLLYEACALGIPSMVISQNKAQNDEAILFEKAEAVISVGVNDAVPDEDILKNLRWMFANNYLRERMTLCGRQFISANGSDHIVTKILQSVLPVGKRM